MKLLVFEYITGGGLAGQALPASMAAEGRMMLQALLDDLKLLSDLQLLLPLDDRCADVSTPLDTQVFVVNQTDNIKQLLSELMTQADLVWPIAPESHGVLADIARQVKSQRKTLLLSAPETVSMCADKLTTYQSLKLNGVAVVETRPLSGLTKSPFQRSVIKPRDGEGCDGNQILENQAQFVAAMRHLDAARHYYVVQPLLEGQALSLSCLFKQGSGWLLCCNQQQMVIENNQFCLQACVVNVTTHRHAFFQSLVNEIAVSMPGLWGYIGIDMIETADHGLQILEINPRLTTSYVGIRQATGINVAEQVLQLLQGEPAINPTKHQSVRVVIH